MHQRRITAGRRMYLRPVAWIWIAGLALFVLLAVSSALFSWPKGQPVTFTSKLNLNPKHSILVFAPHTDDEILGTGGLLGRTAAKGARIHVVFITNGDGFRAAVQKRFGKNDVNPAKYIELGELRQSEAVSALGRLGVKEGAAIFLGYPDHGIEPMWTTNWELDRPYRSIHTGLTRSPYRNSFHHGMPYSGEALLRDIKAILKEYEPDDLYIPHPNDMHPDHWATNAFAITALEQLKSEGWPFARKVRIFTYLVHRGNWPYPGGKHLENPLFPPNSLANLGLAWLEFPLSREEARMKYEAILRYKSQVAVMRRYLVSFARRNELFSEYRPVNPLPVEDDAIQIDGSAADWGDNRPAIIDPVADSPLKAYRDTFRKNITGPVDIKAVYAANSPRFLFLRLDLKEPPKPDVTYRIYLYNVLAAQHLDIDLKTSGIQRVTNLDANRPIWKSSWGSGSDEAIQEAMNGRTIELRVPLRALARPPGQEGVLPSQRAMRGFKARKLFVGAETLQYGTKMDRVAWTVLDLNL